MKLQHQFVLAGLAVSLLCLLCAGILQIEWNHHNRLEQRIREVLDIDNIITRSYLLNYETAGASKGSDPFSRLRFNLLLRGGILGLYSPDEVEEIGEHESNPLTQAMAEIQPSERGHRLTVRNSRHFLTVYQWLTHENSVFFKSVRFDITATIEMRQSEYSRFLLLLALTSLVLTVLFSLVSNRLSRSLRLLSRGVHSITDGEYSERLYLKGNREVASLSVDFNAMAETLEEKHQTLEKRNRAQNELLRNITHELRIPLTNILGYAEMVQTREASSEEVLDWNGYIEREAQRLLNTSTLLRNYILLEDKAIPILPIRSEQFFDDLKQCCTPLVHESGISLRFDCPRTVFSGNADLLTAACVNLIDNAQKASDKGMVIEIELRQTSGITSILIRDKGTGISREELANINDPLYQMNKARPSGRKGLGLGLSITKRIMALHSGSLSLESEEDKGTTALISWPKEIPVG